MEIDRVHQSAAHHVRPQPVRDVLVEAAIRSVRGGLGELQSPAEIRDVANVVSDLRLSHRDPESRRVSFGPQRRAGNPVVGQSLDQAAILVEHPSDNLANSAGVGDRMNFVPSYEAVFQKRCRLAEMANTNKSDVSLFGEV